jgi:hypothetical protein
VTRLLVAVILLTAVIETLPQLSAGQQPPGNATPSNATPTNAKPTSAPPTNATPSEPQPTNTTPSDPSSANATPANASAPAPIASDPAAVTFATDIGLMLVAVKPGATADYEAAIVALQEALAKADDEETRALAKGWRVYKTDQPDAKSNAIYVHLLQPTVPGADYRPSLLLDKLLAGAPAELLAKYRDSFALPPTKLSLTEFAHMAVAPVAKPANTSPDAPTAPAAPANATPGNASPPAPPRNATPGNASPPAAPANATPGNASPRKPPGGEIERLRD